MTDWRYQGQGMRRRMGAPSSHLEAANREADEADEAARAGEHWHEPKGDDGYNEPDERGFFPFEYYPRGEITQQHPACPTCNREMRGR